MKGRRHDTASQSGGSSGGSPPTNAESALSGALNISISFVELTGIEPAASRVRF